MRAIKTNGVVPEMYFTGKTQGESIHNHSEMENGMKGFLDGVRKSSKLSPKWDDAIDAILDVYLGDEPEKFLVDGKYYTPNEYAKSLNINPDDYVNLSSFTHHPFYEQFILEIPDNYSNGSFYNVPVEELEAIMYNAIKNGYTIAWDGDVSEKGFSAKDGIAVLPEDEGNIDFTKRMKEIKPSQSLRQSLFEEYTTTDDHLMHIVGLSKDGDGNEYFKVKNSWGEISDYKGYLFMSKTYANMKTMAIMVHKNAIPKAIYDKLKVCK
jgi:bleomycin hydrolase